MHDRLSDRVGQFFRQWLMAFEIQLNTFFIGSKNSGLPVPCRAEGGERKTTDHRKIGTCFPGSSYGKGLFVSQANKRRNIWYPLWLRDHLSYRCCWRHEPVYFTAFRCAASNDKVHLKMTGVPMFDKPVLQFG